MRIHSTLKNPPNSHVKPSAPQNQRDKIHKQLETSNMQAKNKSAESGILVSLDSIQLRGIEK
jgi:hypothetical protein